MDPQHCPPGPPHCGEREVPGGAGRRQHHRHRRLDDHLRGRDTQLHRWAEHRGRLLRVNPDGDLCERGRHVRGVPARARGLCRSQFASVIYSQSVLWIRITLMRIRIWNYHPDADPDSCFFLYGCGSRSNFSPDLDPDPDPSFQIKAQALEKVLR